MNRLAMTECHSEYRIFGAVQVYMMMNKRFGKHRKEEKEEGNVCTAHIKLKKKCMRLGLIYLTLIYSTPHAGQKPFRRQQRKHKSTGML